MAKNVKVANDQETSGESLEVVWLNVKSCDKKTSEKEEDIDAMGNWREAQPRGRWGKL